MENDDKTKVQISDEINNILSANGGTKVSQNQLAEKIGISPAQLINIRTPAKWSKVSENMWQRATVFFSMQKDWRIIETKNFQRITLSCSEAKKHSRFLAVVGRSGYGKTTALKATARNTKNVFYVLAKDILSRKGFFKAIAKVLGVETMGTIETLLESIVSKINSLDSPLIIIDDAGKLNDGNYRNLQLLYDETEGKCGILIAGTPFLKEYITRMTFKGKYGFDELSRRIEHWTVLEEPNKKEIESVATHNGIEDKEGINFLYNTCKNFGTLHTVIVNAKRKSEKPDSELLMLVKGN